MHNQYNSHFSLIFMFQYGMVYYIYPEQIGNSLSSAFTMSLNPNFTYGIFFADPNFFFINPLPSYFPRTFIQVPKMAGNLIISLKVSMNMKYRSHKVSWMFIWYIFYFSTNSSLSNRNETFSKCIDRKVYETIVCVSQWETENVTGSSLRRCSTYQDFQKMMDEYSLESFSF